MAVDYCGAGNLQGTKSKINNKIKNLKNKIIKPQIQENQDKFWPPDIPGSAFQKILGPPNTGSPGQERQVPYCTGLKTECNLKRRGFMLTPSGNGRCC